MKKTHTQIGLTDFASCYKNLIFFLVKKKKKKQESHCVQTIKSHALFLFDSAVKHRTKIATPRDKVESQVSKDGKFKDELPLLKGQYCQSFTS